MALFKVFLSSPFRGLMDKRRLIHKAVEKACSAIGIVKMESRPPTDELSAKACLNELRKCNIYLGILSSTYGTVIPREQLEDAEGPNAYKYYGLSYTYYEFKKAGELDIPRIVFLQTVEDEGCLPSELREFRSEVQRNVTPSYFEEDRLQELTCQVVESLRQRIPEWICEGKLRLPSFYGRLDILGELYGLLTDERMLNNTLCIHGVGGIGKSALAEALMLLLSVRGYKISKLRSIGGRKPASSLLQIT